jgi:hypothetical protein
VYWRVPVREPFDSIQEMYAAAVFEADTQPDDLSLDSVVVVGTPELGTSRVDDPDVALGAVCSVLREFDGGVRVDDVVTVLGVFTAPVPPQAAPRQRESKSAVHRPTIP